MKTGKPLITKARFSNVFFPPRMVHDSCSTSQRITPWDVLGGLVLLGLLIAQVFAPLVSLQRGHPLSVDAHHSELPVQFLIQLLVSGQFEQMGSFLLGLGLYRYWQQANLVGPGLEGGIPVGRYPAGMNAHRIVRRLLFGLLSLGLTLSLLLRSTDLLLVYALLGFTLLYFRKQSVNNLLTWLVGLALLAILISSGPAQLHPARLSLLTQAVLRYLSYEMLLLGGLLVGKLELLPPAPRLRVRLSLLQLGVLPTAFLVKGAWVVLSLGLVALPIKLVAYQIVLVDLCGFLGPLLLSGVYLLEVGLNARLTQSGWTRWMGRIGQMSLTNYILQSILYLLLLLGYEVIVTGSPPVWARAGILVGIYGFQIGFSYIWGKRYQQGPLEWICHHWIYRKWGQWKTAPKVKL